MKKAEYYKLSGLLQTLKVHSVWNIETQQVITKFT